MSEQQSPETSPKPQRAIGARRASGIVIASGLTAVSSLVIQILSARTLSVEDNKEFLVFWSFLFAVLGIIAGTQTETTRAVSSALQEPAPARDRSGARVLWVSMGIGAVVALLMVVGSPLWAPRVAPTQPLLATIVVAAGIVGYAGAMSVSGAFAGLKLWNHYSGLMAGESVTRFLLVLLCVVGGIGLAGFEVASAAPVLFWLILLVTVGGRRASRMRADVEWPQLVRNNLQAMVSSAASAILMTGFATMLEVTSVGEDPRVLATTMLAVSLTRSPIMIPLQAFQGVLISWVAGSKTGYLRPLGKIFGLLAGLGAVAAVAAGAIGPWLMRILFGPDYDPAWWILAGLTVAAVSVAALVLTGAVSVGLSEHRAYAIGWVVAAASSFVLLFLLPGDAPTRAVIALILAPMMGAAVHVYAILRHRSN